MKTLFVLGKDQEIIGEVKYNPHPNIMYFYQSIAHAFSVDIQQIISKEEYYKKNNVYLCSVCNETPVDVLDGYDTCPDCIGKI
jgi:hypothetical protein